MCLFCLLMKYDYNIKRRISIMSNISYNKESDIILHYDLEKPIKFYSSKRMQLEKYIHLPAYTKFNNKTKTKAKVKLDWCDHPSVTILETFEL